MIKQRAALEAVLAREDELRVVARLAVMVHRIESHPFAHRHAEAAGEIAHGSAEGIVIGDQQQRAAAANPRIDRIDFRGRERRRGRGVVGAHRGGDDEHRRVVQRGSRHDIVECIDLVAVALEQLCERLVRVRDRVAVVMRRVSSSNSARWLSSRG